MEISAKTVKDLQPLTVFAKNALTQNHLEHDVSRTTQVSYLAKFKATRSKLGEKGHRNSVPKTLCTL